VAADGHVGMHVHQASYLHDHIVGAYSACSNGRACERWLDILVRWKTVANCASR